MSSVNRVGIYDWAGPGTIRLLRTKYHSPVIDEKSFETAYEEQTLKKQKDLFGVTDAWISYSWGFSDKTEQEDYEFLRKKIDVFHRLGIRTHAYVQGLNAVLADFASEDIWCRDPWGNKLAYSKGRAFTCPNNPRARELILNRVSKARDEAVDGVYVDNILFGYPPLVVYSDFLPFFGCACAYCQRKFKQQYGYGLPQTFTGRQIHEYLNFRAQSTTSLINDCSAIVHSKKKEFGINLYDPTLRLDSLYYGYSLPVIADDLDYFLIENHSFPTESESKNDSLIELKQRYPNKRLFLVTYRNGIGEEENYTQKDISALFSDAQSIGVFPCLKATEFTTHGVWHTLRLEGLHSPEIHLLRLKSHQNILRIAPRSTRLSRNVLFHVQKNVIPLVQNLLESPFLSRLMVSSGTYRRQLLARRYQQL